MKSVRSDEYLALLKKRALDSRVTQPFQLVGLEIAVILKDLRHKALYIKYAKEYDPDKLLALAKEVSQKRGVENPAAYFMRLVMNIKKESLGTPLKVRGGRGS